MPCARSGAQAREAAILQSSAQPNNKDGLGAPLAQQQRERKSGEVRIGQVGGRRAQGGDMPMGTAACGGRGFKGRAEVSGERPMGVAGCRQTATRPRVPTRCLAKPPPPPLPLYQRLHLHLCLAPLNSVPISDSLPSPHWHKV